jgi:hypothetical protein
MPCVGKQQCCAGAGTSQPASSAAYVETIAVDFSHHDVATLVVMYCTLQAPASYCQLRHLRCIEPAVADLQCVQGGGQLSQRCYCA